MTQTTHDLIAHITSLPLEKQEQLWQMIEKKGTEFNILPLSYAQERLWIMEQLQPGNIAYHIPLVNHIHGHLDKAVFSQCFDEIIRRHESLRTNFVSIAGKAAQIIHPPAPCKVQVIDLAAVPGPEQEAAVTRLVSELVQRPFDLVYDPLLRVTLLQLAETSQVLVVVLHHIISDGWSMSVLVKELTALYNAFVQKRPSPLPELPIQYADFSIWQREYLPGKVIETQLAYWKQKLAGPLPTLQLSTRQPHKPGPQRIHRGVHEVILSAALTNALKALSQQEEITLFMTMLAAFKVLLYRSTGEEDIIVGTDVANRSYAETQSLIGFFVNQLTLRTDLSGKPTFLEVMGRVRTTTLEAAYHQDLPFHKLVEALNPKRQQNTFPLFQVKFIGGEFENLNLTLQGLTYVPMAVHTGVEEMDLILSTFLNGRNIEVTWRYNAHLFEEAAIAYMAQYYKAILENIVARPDTRIDNLGAFTENEKKRLQELKRQNRKKLKISSSNRRA